MAGLTLANLYTRVAVNTQDLDPVTGLPLFRYFPKSSVVGWLNDAITDVCRKIPQKQYITYGLSPNPVLPANATAEYVPINGDTTTLDQIISLSAGNLPLIPISAEDAAQMYPQDWERRTGTALYFIYNEFAPGVVKLIPDPSAALTTVRGMATLKPVLLVAGPSANIAAATNAAPIVVTAANHGFVTGNQITISGVLGNTAANGSWAVTVTDANTFSLNTSVGNGAYTASGLALKPADDNNYPPFDSEFHQLCEFYATARCLLMDAETQDESKAKDWMGLYTAGLQEYRIKQSRNFTLAVRPIAHENF